MKARPRLLLSSGLTNGQLPSYRLARTPNREFHTLVRLHEDQHYRAQEKNGDDLSETHGILAAVHFRWWNCAVFYQTPKTVCEPEDIYGKVAGVRANKGHQREVHPANRANENDQYCAAEPLRATFEKSR